MTLADLIQNIIDSSKERIKNPIVGAFICSFFVYNWRPFFLLMFSDDKIENRIELINHKYCTSNAVFYPFMVALILTIAIPFLNIVLDAILVFARKQRVKNDYQNQTDVYDERIKLAAKVLELKNAESGNREKQNLLDQIKGLEETNQQITESTKNRINALNLELEKANITISGLQDFGDNSFEVRDRVQKIMTGDFSPLELEYLLRFKTVEKGRVIFTTNSYPKGLLEDLLLLNIFRKDDRSYYITDFGKDYFKNLENKK